MIPQFRAAEYLYETLVPGETSTPLTLAPYSYDRELSAAFLEEAEPFAEFIRTRVARRATRVPVLAAISLAVESPWRWVRLGSKGILRLAPFVGWGLLAYDLYTLGDELDIY